MFTCECLLAAALLGGPSDVPVAREDAPWIEILRPSILAVAIDAEVLDPREKSFVMGQDLAGDLAMLQGRYAEFARAPALAEGQRFPDRKLINEFMSMNRAVRNGLQQRQQLDLVHADLIDAAIQETDQLYQVWDTVRDARCDYYYVTVRRQALTLLRGLLGPEAFYTGQLPPHVPVWHFSRER